MIDGAQAAPPEAAEYRVLPLATSGMALTGCSRMGEQDSFLQLLPVSMGAGVIGKKKKRSE